MLTTDRVVGRILKQDLICPVGNTIPITPGDPYGTVNSRSDSVGTTNSYNRLSRLTVQNRNGWLDSLKYDGSGNITSKREGPTGVRHFFTTDPAHNRVVRDSVPTFVPLTISYDTNGSRITEIGNIQDLREKHYYYDAPSRLSGTFEWVGANTHDAPNPCRYWWRDWRGARYELTDAPTTPLMPLVEQRC